MSVPNKLLKGSIYYTMRNKIVFFGFILNRDGE